MKIEVGEERALVLRDVYSGVMFITEDGQRLSVCMRDGGFEVGLFRKPPDDGTGMKQPLVGPEWVSVQDGAIHYLKQKPNCGCGCDTNCDPTPDCLVPDPRKIDPEDLRKPMDL